MADIGVGTWTVAALPTAGPSTGGSPPHSERVVIRGKRKTSYIRFDLAGNGDLVYPSSGGLPLPSWRATTNTGDTSYGMVRNVYQYKMIGTPGVSGVKGILWQFVPTDRAIRGYWPANPTAAGGPSFMVELPTTLKVSQISTAGISFTFEVEGW